MNQFDPRDTRTNDSLIIPRRQASVLVAVGFLAASCLFMGGYFFGKRHAAAELSLYLEEGALSEQIYASLKFPGGELKADEHRLQELVAAKTEAPALATQEPLVQPEMVVSSEETFPHNGGLQAFRAQLISFGTSQAAERFAQKLQRKNIPVQVEKRISTTAKGKKINWYQIVTDLYTNKSELERLVDRISKEEKIKGACIVTC